MGYTTATVAVFRCWPSRRKFLATKSGADIFRRPNQNISSRSAATIANWFRSRNRCRACWRLRCRRHCHGAALAKLLNKSKKITIMGGAGCAGAHAKLIELAGKLNAPIVHAMRGKEFIEYDNPFDVGMTGLLGFSSGYHAMMDS